jgi:phosphoserine phosphatase
MSAATLLSPSGVTAMLIAGDDAPPPPMPGATDIVLVRHGETDWNRDGRCQGAAEIPLNAVGAAQVAAVRDQLAGVTFDAAYASGLTRAHETAQILLAHTGLLARRIGDMREIDYGRVTGLRPEEWHSVEPTLDARWRSAPWDVAFPGGESLAEVARRVIPVWEGLVAAHRGDRILLAGHGHVHRLLLLHCTNTEPHKFWDIAQPNAGVWHVRIPPTPSSDA